MKRSKFTVDQIAFALRRVGLRISVERVCRKTSISDADYLRVTEIVRRGWHIRAALACANRGDRTSITTGLPRANAA